MIAAATRCRPTRAILLALVSANAAGTSKESAVSPMVTLEEPLTGGRAAPVQQCDEHPADDSGDEGDLGEAGEGDLAVHGQRDSAAPQGSRSGGRDRGGQHTYRERGPRQCPCQPGPGTPDR